MEKSACLALWNSDPSEKERIINVLVCDGITESIADPLQMLCLQRQYQSWASKCTLNWYEGDVQEMLNLECVCSLL